MPEFLSLPGGAVQGEPLLLVLLRLIAAMVLGGAVALVYRHARSEPPSSFTATLVLLSILIAMVTQVIGDNVARAFSLVGALSIVRFRTVVRDTQDTAYVIFAVAVGMAVGASNLWVALAGVAVTALAAFLLRGQSAPEQVQPFRVAVRIGVVPDARALLGPTLEAHTARHQLVSAAMVKQGTATELVYEATPRTDRSDHDLMAALGRLDGVQRVTLRRAGAAERVAPAERPEQS